METLQNEIISFMGITIVILLLALLTIKMEKRYKKK
jgi:Na+-transporting methylmalonyl-CoA/oxaloacetate decarboxylase gamma subunit